MYPKKYLSKCEKKNGTILSIRRYCYIILQSNIIYIAKFFIFKIWWKFLVFINLGHTIKKYQESLSTSWLHICTEPCNPFHANDLFWCPLKTSENLWFSNVFRGYQKRSVTWNGLKFNLTNWSNTLKQFVGKTLRSCQLRVSEWIWELPECQGTPCSKKDRRDIWRLSDSNGIWTHNT